MWTQSDAFFLHLREGELSKFYWWMYVHIYYTDINKYVFDEGLSQSYSD